MLNRKSTNRCLLVAFLWTLAFAFVVSLQGQAFAQTDSSFREFGEDLVPTPTELSEILALLKLKQEPMSDFNQAIMDQLQESGKELYDQLDDEQKKKG
mgnify:CR=1 FL=1